MKLKPYPSYKDSGVEWLGEVPQHWEVRRVSHFFSERREKVSDKDYQPLSVTKNGVVPQLETAAKTDDGDNRKLVIAGDFVINSRSDRKGSSGLSELDGSVSLINTVLKPYGHTDGRFAHHLFRSHPFQEEFYRYGKGIVADLWSTNYSEMRNISLAIPENSEQTTIATFLDRETAKLDTLISKQEHLIELLQEKRQAIISHAVTKGLDPDVPMKDSGIEWLGDVPVIWKLKPLFSVCRERNERNLGMREQNLLSLSFGRIVNKDIDSNEGLLPESFETYQVIYKGDIVFRLTDLQNDKRSLRTAIVRERGIITSAYIAVEPHDISPEYLNYLLRGYDTQKVFYSMGGGLRQSMKFSDLRRLPILVPNNKLQNEIVSYLDQETSKIDTLIERARQSIQLAKEHRTALISATVTGKIDVREAA